MYYYGGYSGTNNSGCGCGNNSYANAYQYPTYGGSGYG